MEHSKPKSQHLTRSHLVLDIPWQANIYEDIRSLVPRYWSTTLTGRHPERHPASMAKDFVMGHNYFSPLAAFFKPDLKS